MLHPRGEVCNRCLANRDDSRSVTPRCKFLQNSRGKIRFSTIRSRLFNTNFRSSISQIEVTSEKNKWDIFFHRHRHARFFSVNYDVLMYDGTNHTIELIKRMSRSYVYMRENNARQYISAFRFVTSNGESSAMRNLLVDLADTNPDSVVDIFTFVRTVIATPRCCRDVVATPSGLTDDIFEISPRLRATTT